MSPDGLGWIIVDSLDTMMIMNLTSRLSDAREWIQESLTYDQNQDVNTFETTIRMLGGLLSAHYLSARLPDVSSGQDSVYLSKAVDLADRLLGAYESESGIPYASIDLRTGKGIRSHADGGSSSMAEAATLQLEMKYLADITGNEAYWRKAEKVMEVLDANNMQDGLLPIFVDPASGRFTTREIRLGSRGDSYYGTQLFPPCHLSMLQPPLTKPVRVPYQTIPPNLRTNLRRHVEPSNRRNPKTPRHFNKTLKTPNRRRTPQRNRRQTIPQNGPPSLLPPRLNRPRRNRRPHRIPSKEIRNLDT